MATCVVETRVASADFGKNSWAILPAVFGPLPGNAPANATPEPTPKSFPTVAAVMQSSAAFCSSKPWGMSVGGFHSANRTPNLAQHGSKPCLGVSKASALQSASTQVRGELN